MIWSKKFYASIWGIKKRNFWRWVALRTYLLVEMSFNKTFFLIADARMIQLYINLCKPPDISLGVMCQANISQLLCEQIGDVYNYISHQHKPKRFYEKWYHCNLLTHLLSCHVKYVWPNRRWGQICRENSTVKLSDEKFEVETYES